MNQIEIGFREVNDPYDGKPLVVAVNTRCDLLEFLFQRDKIDYAQFHAGRKFLNLVQQAEGSRYLVVDPSREPVDCSVASHGVPDFRLDAANQLVRLSQRLGQRDYRLARRLIARDVGAYPDPRSRREKEYQCRRLRDVLDDLATIWGYAAKAA